MVQGYFTLQEAAAHLNISLDELKVMAQKGKIRSFQDRGTLRFRIQDIQELARQRGISSEPELVLGDASLPPKKGEGPRSPKSPTAPKTPPREQVPDVFEFEFDDESVDLGADPSPPASPSKKPSSKPKSGTTPKSGIKPRSSAQIPQAKEPPPRSGNTPRSGGVIKPRSSPQIPQAKEPPRSGQPRSGTTPKSGGVARDSGAKPGSDSDVKLVTGSRDDVNVSGAPDSDIKLREKGSSSSKSPSSLGQPPKGGQPPTSDPTKKRTSKLGPHSPRPGDDSGVRLVPMDSDSDVKIVGGGDEVPLGQSPGGTLADSNVKLEKPVFPPSQEDSGTMLTDEINLDEELRKEEERKKQQPQRQSKVKPKSQLKFPTTSPFELSDSDVDPPSSAPGTAPKSKPPAAPAAGGPTTPKGKGSLSDSSDFEMTAAKDDSSNFDLAPAGTEDSSNFDLQVSPGDSSNFEIAAMKDESSSNFEVAPLDNSGAVATPPGSSEDDFSLELEESESALGGEGGGELTAPASGINLGNPTDKGISLEQQKASDDSLEFDLSLEPEATPKPAQMKPVEGSEAGSSEFELSLDLEEEGKKKGSAAEDSDSEFELTLDDSSELQAGTQAKEGETQDIFESDFEIPSLQDEGSAEPATVDTELESSDFDLALDDSELAADEESGSQVVALDEEEVEPVAEEEVEVDVDEEGFGDLEGDEVEVEEDDTRPARVEIREKILKPAPWGPVPALVMPFCVVVMLLVGLIGFEVVQSSLGQRPPGMMTRALNDGVLVPLSISKPLMK
jgi:excisionase family DNA binding protein